MGPAPSAVADATLTVDTFGDTFDGSCADADCSISDAVASVDPGGTVRVPPGFYPLDRSGDRSERRRRRSSRLTIVGTGETGTFVDVRPRSGIACSMCQRTSRFAISRCSAGAGSDEEGFSGQSRHTRRESLHGSSAAERTTEEPSGGERRHRIDRPVVSPTTERPFAAAGFTSLGTTVVFSLHRRSRESRGGRRAAPSSVRPASLGDRGRDRLEERGGPWRTRPGYRRHRALLRVDRGEPSRRGGGVLISPESESSTANSVSRATAPPTTDRCASGRCLRMDATSPMSEAAVSRRRMTGPVSTHGSDHSDRTAARRRPTH